MLQGTYVSAGSHPAPIRPQLTHHFLVGAFFQMPHVGSVTWVLPQYPVLSPTALVALGLEFVFSPRLHAAWQGHCVCYTVGDHWALEHQMSVEGGGKEGGHCGHRMQPMSSSPSHKLTFNTSLLTFPPSPPALWPQPRKPPSHLHSYPLSHCLSTVFSLVTTYKWPSRSGLLIFPKQEAVGRSLDSHLRPTQALCPACPWQLYVILPQDMMDHIECGSLTEGGAPSVQL